MLVRLLYASRAVNPIESDVLDEILEQSREYNRTRGITGMLCACEETNGFLQVLEGGREEINRLYNVIVRDERHTDVVLLAYDEISERAFANWRMARIDLNRVNPSVLLRYSERPQLDPLLLSGDAAMALMQDLINALSAS